MATELTPEEARKRGPKDLGPGFEVGRGADVSPADHAEMRRRRDAQAVADLPLLGPVEHHLTRVQCEWCPGKVARYASTPDGARHYCRGCISLIARQFGVELPRTVQP